MNVKERLREKCFDVQTTFNEIPTGQVVLVVTISDALTICNEVVEEAISEKNLLINDLTDTISIKNSIIESMDNERAYDNINCQCGDESIGWTDIECCNICGLPIPKSDWTMPLRKLIDEAKKEGYKEGIKESISCLKNNRSKNVMVRGVQAGIIKPVDVAIDDTIKELQQKLEDKL
jgi:hypothetical protein